MNNICAIFDANILSCNVNYIHELSVIGFGPWDHQCSHIYNLSECVIDEHLKTFPVAEYGLYREIDGDPWHKAYSDIYEHYNYYKTPLKNVIGVVENHKFQKILEEQNLPFVDLSVKMGVPVYRNCTNSDPFNDRACQRHYGSAKGCTAARVYACRAWIALNIIGLDM